MLRWSLLSLALLFFAVGLLTVFRSPDWNLWQLALLAGEFGHWLALAAFATAVAVWATRNSLGALWPLMLGLSLGAMVLLLKPTYEAREVGERAVTELDRIGAPASVQLPFSVAGFFRRNPADVPIKTLKFSEDLVMDFFPAVGRTEAPCVIVVHGGGWDRGDRKQLPGLNHWLARRGYAVAAISYRLAPKFVWPAQRNDVLDAIAFLKAQAKGLGVDPTRLVLLGRSAGGQIAEVVAYSTHDPAIRGLVGLYSPSDLHFAYKYGRDDDVLKSPGLIRRFLGGPPETARANFDSATALQQVTRDAPPTLLIHGELDTLVWHRHSVRLEAVLERAGVPCVFISLPWATHAFEFNLAGPGGQLTTYALERFLARVTR
jgi:acetyl esterase/lipase